MSLIVDNAILSPALSASFIERDISSLIGTINLYSLSSSDEFFHSLLNTSKSGKGMLNLTCDILNHALDLLISVL
jgi:hypothetical protein